MWEWLSEHGATVGVAVGSAKIGVALDRVGVMSNGVGGLDSEVGLYGRRRFTGKGLPPGRLGTGTR
jgi:hypothetical protein